MQVDFAIITVLAEEYKAMESRLPAPSYRQRGKSGRNYMCSKVRTKDGKRYSVALARSTVPGLQAAQQVASDIINDLSPSLLLIVGIAGGVPDTDLALGDVVVAASVLNFGVNAFKNGEVEWSVQGGTSASVEELVANLLMYDSALDGWNTQEAIGMPRPTLNEAQYKGFDLAQFTETEAQTLFDEPALPAWREKIMEALLVRLGNSSQPSYTTGSIASSGTLIRDTGILRQLLRGARNIRAVEMETAGVFQAAQQLRQKDYPVIAIRGISNLVGLKCDNVLWKQYACQSAASFAYAFLTADSSIFDNLNLRPGVEEEENPEEEEVEGAVKLYIMYDKADEEHKKELIKHLALLKRWKLVSTWHSYQMNHGVQKYVLDPHLDAAQLILLLVSPDFMASDLTYDYQMGRAMERRRCEKDVHITPILLRDVGIEATPIAELQALPRDRKSIAMRSEAERDKAWTEIATDIRKIAESLQQSLKAGS